ncbi:MAG: DUF3164 family protein [Pseudomonadota bacterium]
MTEQANAYMTNSQGHLVPRELVAEIDLLRNDLVAEIVAKAEALQAAIKDFKYTAMADIGAFIELSAEKYGCKLGGTKGNVTLTSYDGQYKIQRAVAEHITFDERLQVAKELIDECITRWAEGSRSEIRALVNHAFQVDSQGKVSTGRVLGLRRLSITDPQWQQAMQAITDSLQVVGSKSYIRIYKRVGVSDRFDPVALDVAGV